MAVKFLDKTGLGYFWGKIKAWCNATFAAITHSHAWSAITGKPTTISGYGITDAKISSGTITLGSNTITPLTSHQTLPTLSRTISGSGNAITDITVSGHAITATKGTTFLTSHQTLPTLSLTTSGSGNAITALSVSDHAITATKGSTFLTSHQSLANYVTLNGAQTISAVKTFTAKPVLNQVGLDMTVKDTTEGSTTTRTSQVLHANSSNSAYGINFALCTGGNAVIGGGEAGTAQLNALAGNSGEDLYLVADGNIYLKPNGNTWANVKTITLNNAAELSGLAKVTSTSFVGALTGNCSGSSGSCTGNAATATKTTATIAVDTTGELVRATMGSNDVFRIAVGGASNAGWAEIATGDDYSEPIYVRQYQGSFATLKRTATLLDASGNTSFPGTVTAVGFSGPLTGDVNGNATTVTGTAGTSLLAWNTENTVYTVGGHAIKVKLPANPNTDTHWTSHLYAGASNGNANAATTNGNTYLIICDNSTARDRRLIKGTGATTVTSDANGVITIHSTDNNTTYSVATQSANGLMSAADKKKLDGIAAGADSIPVGAIIYYAHKTVPANFLICNGGAVSRTTYATLFNLIGTTYGAGNGSSTFNVPNLIGRFPEGNATPGTVHNAGLPNITGSLDTVRAYLWDGESGSFYPTHNSSVVLNAVQVSGDNQGAWQTHFDASRSSAIYGKSSTVQPPALTLVPCIRYA